MTFTYLSNVFFLPPYIYSAVMLLWTSWFSCFQTCLTRRCPALICFDSPLTSTVKGDLRVIHLLLHLMRLCLPAC